MTENVLDSEGLAEALGITSDQVNILRRNGLIPYYQIGVGTIRYRLSDVLTATRVSTHPDDKALDAFTAEMREKLAHSRSLGRSGWEDPSQCAAPDLAKLLVHAVAKGDPVDVGNFAMMLHQRKVEPGVIWAAYAEMGGRLP